MNFFPDHVVVAPIIVPLLTGAILLFIDERTENGDSAAEDRATQKQQ